MVVVVAGHGGGASALPCFVAMPMGDMPRYMVPCSRAPVLIYISMALVEGILYQRSIGQHALLIYVAKRKGSTPPMPTYSSHDIYLLPYDDDIRVMAWPLLICSASKVGVINIVAQPCMAKAFSFLVRALYENQKTVKEKDSNPTSNMIYNDNQRKRKRRHCNLTKAKRHMPAKPTCLLNNRCVVTNERAAAWR